MDGWENLFSTDRMKRLRSPESYKQKVDQDLALPPPCGSRCAGRGRREPCRPGWVGQQSKFVQKLATDTLVESWTCEYSRPVRGEGGRWAPSMELELARMGGSYNCTLRWFQQGKDFVFWAWDTDSIYKHLAILGPASLASPPLRTGGGGGDGTGGGGGEGTLWSKLCARLR